MKAEELMIGNWVSYKGIPHYVTGIMPPYVDIVEGKGKGKGFVDVHEEEIKPIEITSQILIKNDFKMSIDDDYYKQTTGHTFACHKFNDGTYRVAIYANLQALCMVQTQYIHQLQNACSLVDKELEIKL